MEFNTNSGIWGTMFGVPHVVADNFLKLATGQQLKVLLYLLRCSGRKCSEEEIVRNTGVTPQEAADAVLFWQQVNVLTPAQSFSNSSAVPNIITVQTPIQESAAPVINAKTPTPAEAPQKQNLSPSEISKIMKGSDEISELFKVAESALGPLSHTQQNSLIWMSDYLGLKCEVIVTLIYYCLDIEKTNSAYMEKIAYSWHENDINTLNAAQEEVERLTSTREYSGKIMKIFGLSNRPTKKQSELIAQWKSSGFSTELIEYALEKCLDQINKVNFDYINKILLSWKDSGFTEPGQVKNAESSYSQKKRRVKSSDDKDLDIEKYNVVINKF